MEIGMLKAYDPMLAIKDSPMYKTYAQLITTAVEPTLTQYAAEHNMMVEVKNVEFSGSSQRRRRRRGLSIYASAHVETVFSREMGPLEEPDTTQLGGVFNNGLSSEIANTIRNSQNYLINTAFVPLVATITYIG